MLRTFMANPGLGGFGEREEATPDAFCQIVKELVDNAVDACCGGVIGEDVVASSTVNRRVRVVIEEYKQGLLRIQNDESPDGGKLLRVTVSDNGCGMDCIQTCVGAFHSSKQGDQAGSVASKESISSFSKKDQSTFQKQKNQKSKAKAPSSMDKNTTQGCHDEAQTAGRYGIGLTLCLLHAQRLVPASCASIQSATRRDKAWNVVQAVVETELDTIRCIPSPQLQKSSPNESGTSIGVLLPGGTSAVEAWPRLAEYLARFKLSMGLTCSLEVLAPTLSRVPLFIKPSNRKSAKSDKTTKQSEHSTEWRDGFHDEVEQEATATRSRRITKQRKVAQQLSKDNTLQAKRQDICSAACQFLGRSVDPLNVAYEAVPIQSKKGQMTKRKRGSKCDDPTLEVAIIVHGPSSAEDDREDSDEALEDDSERVPTGNGEWEGDIVEAKMTLVRMVNKIPLLDSTEAVACGLVQGLATKKKLWNSFGLEVSLDMEPISRSLAPSYNVRDSDQVESMIRRGVHELLQPSHDSDQPPDDDGNESVHRFRMLPAKIRLGNILVVIQIHAKPSTLPLPTLSKGRLPVNEASIDTALEVGLSKCLQQLQENNPSLLLTGAGLRRAERDARYVPAIAEAIASVLLNSSRPDATRITKITSWKAETVENSEAASRSQLPDLSFTEGTSEVLCRALEKRIRFVLAQPERTKNSENELESVSDKSFSEGDPLSPVDIDWSLLHDGLDENSTSKVGFVGISGSADEPKPKSTYKDPRKLLYASSYDDCDGYEDW